MIIFTGEVRLNSVLILPDQIRTLSLSGHPVLDGWELSGWTGCYPVGSENALVKVEPGPGWS